MKILFLHPMKFYERWPIPPDTTRAVFNFPSVTFPQLSATVHDHDLELLDGVVERTDRRKFRRKVKAADIIAISISSSCLTLNTEINLRAIRKINPGARIIMGGHHATFYHGDWAKRGVDFVVRNEGEATFPELVDAIDNRKSLKGIKGITYNQGGKVIVNPDRPLIDNMDSLPIPNWDLLDLKKYDFYPKKKGLSGSLETSRGCCHSCKFCAVNSMWRGRQRFKSAGRVLEEMRILHEKGVRKFAFVDDNFGANYKRDVDICRGILDGGMDINWFSFGRVDSIIKHPDLYEKAAESGLKVVLVGFENFSQNLLDTFRKDFKSDSVTKSYVELYEFLKKNGIFVYGLFVLGYPGDSKDGIGAIIKRSKKVCDKRSLSTFRPILGTAGYEDVLGGGKAIRDMFYYDSQVPVIDDLEFYIKKTRREFFKDMISPDRMYKIVNGGENERDFFRSYYKFILKKTLSVTPRKLIDFLGMTIYGNSMEYDYNRFLSKRYLSDGFIEKIVG